ncbi:hypothetical protein [Methanoregula sp.]|uniref:hypothetical protein n=1 Tax=Methanoregula sp. TaxID=2052170 RepID=UPI0035673A27
MDGIESGKRILDVLSDRIIAITSRRTMLAALAGLLVTAFLINGRPFGIAELNAITGGVGVLDMEVLYTPDQAYAFLAIMGEAGRAFYVTHIALLDMFVPFFYALFLSTVISWLLHTWLPAESRWHRLNLVPVIGGLCDYLENFGIIAMLLAWPAYLPDIAGFTMAATLLKFAFSALAGIILIGAVAGRAISSIKGRKTRSPAL